MKRKPMPLPARTCYCNCEFIPKNARNIYCSDECYKRYHNARQRLLDGKIDAIVIAPAKEREPYHGMRIPRDGILCGSNRQTVSHGRSPARDGGYHQSCAYDLIDSDLMEQNGGGVRHAKRIA
jgi:hypothetical protein